MDRTDLLREIRRKLSTSTGLSQEEFEKYSGYYLLPGFTVYDWITTALMCDDIVKIDGYYYFVPRTNKIGTRKKGRKIQSG